MVKNVQRPLQVGYGQQQVRLQEGALLVKSFAVSIQPFTLVSRGGGTALVLTALIRRLLIDYILLWNSQMYKEFISGICLFIYGYVLHSGFWINTDCYEIIVL